MLSTCVDLGESHQDDQRMLGRSHINAPATSHEPDLNAVSAVRTVLFDHARPIREAPEAQEWSRNRDRHIAGPISCFYSTTHCRLVSVVNDQPQRCRLCQGKGCKVHLRWMLGS